MLLHGHIRRYLERENNSQINRVITQASREYTRMAIREKNSISTPLKAGVKVIPLNGQMNGSVKK